MLGAPTIDKAAVVSTAPQSHREQVGQLDLSEVAPEGLEDPIPPYDLRGIAGRNADELTRASLVALQRATELGLEPSVMMADETGRIFAEFVDPNSSLTALLEGGAPAGAGEDEDFIDKGWSFAIDNRNYFGTGSGYANNHPSLRRVGELDPGRCSGALFGRRLILTAAHCVVASNGFWSNKTFAPRRQGSTLQGERIKS